MQLRRPGQTPERPSSNVRYSRMPTDPGFLGTCIDLRKAMPEYELLETQTSVDVSKLINQRAQQGWKLISLHVTERSNGSP